MATNIGESGDFSAQFIQALAPPTVQIGQDWEIQCTYAITHNNIEKTVNRFVSFTRFLSFDGKPWIEIKPWSATCNYALRVLCDPALGHCFDPASGEYDGTVTLTNTSGPVSLTQTFTLRWDVLGMISATLQLSLNGTGMNSQLVSVEVKK